jgi:hypothetical protein
MKKKKTKQNRTKNDTRSSRHFFSPSSLLNRCHFVVLPDVGVV